MPIFVSRDSADVWAQRENFTVDEHGNGTVVAGVPPDAFSDDGQLWGNPLFDWPTHKVSDFSWWLDRLRTHFSLFDIIRIDHFRGLEACWEVPATSPTAKDGEWVKAPGAELQFAFDGDYGNHHLPHNHSEDMVVYTGTHDNDTSVSWYNSADDNTKKQLCEYLECGDHDMPWPLMRSAMMSVAKTAIFPMQDVLGLGAGHRMNLPGTVEGNWQWRFDWSQVDGDLAGRLRELTGRYSRVAPEGPIEELGNKWPEVDRRRN